MSNGSETDLGSVVSLWRYPVKSMMGEELNACEVTERGLVGDRAYGLIDNEDGKAATAKNPRKWPHLFAFRSSFAEPAGVQLSGVAKQSASGTRIPAVQIILPDGTTVTSDQDDLNQILSNALNRGVTFRAAQPGAIAEFTLPEGTFFDGAMIHLLTTATLDRLRESYPQGQFEARRFRPNIVVQLAFGEKEFAENAWVGHTLSIGNSVRLNITRPCGRCVMTTLPQGHLPKDPGILRTVAQENDGYVGVYAAVVRGGAIRCGDSIRME